MKRSYSNTFLAATLGLFLTATTFTGCSEDRSPVHPIDSQQTPPATIEPFSETGAMAQSGNTTVYSATFGSSGGTLDGPDADFILSEDAVSVSTTITMTVDSTKPNEVVMGPAGSFAETCLLLMEKPSGYPTGTEFEIYWWDPANSEWVAQGAGDLGPVLSISVDHFSIFKIDQVTP